MSAHDPLRIQYPRREAEERFSLSGSNEGEEADIYGDDIDMDVHDDNQVASEIE